jgi:hypothetical protein
LFFGDGLFYDGSETGDLGEEVGGDVADDRVIDAGIALVVGNEVVWVEVGEEPRAAVDGGDEGAGAGRRGEVRRGVPRCRRGAVRS